MDANGPLDLEKFTVNITSDPPMSTVDIISLLTTGMADTESAATSERETQMAGMSAASVLSENLTGVFGKRVQRLFGLESFRVDPFLAGTENDPTARITISERISRDLVVTFSEHFHERGADRRHRIRCRKRSVRYRHPGRGRKVRPGFPFPEEIPVNSFRHLTRRRKEIYNAKAQRRKDAKTRRTA